MIFYLFSSKNIINLGLKNRVINSFKIKSIYFKMFKISPIPTIKILNNIIVKSVLSKSCFLILNYTD
jgi:hypothetical protein